MIRPLDTLSINRMLFRSRQYGFIGTFPCDKLPRIINFPCSLVINTGPSTTPGEHWVAISFDKDGNGLYFDSFGNPPLKEEILYFLNKYSLYTWKYNPFILQSETSSTCGYYAVLFIRLIIRNVKFKNIINLFYKNTKINDVIITQLTKS